MKRATCGIALAVSVLIAGAADVCAAQSAVPLAPHRAIYDLSLSRSSPGSGVTDISGRIVYELVGSDCEGYTQNMRFVTSITGREGAVEVSDLRTSSWEDAAATKLRFSTSTYENDELEGQSQGTALRSASRAVSVDLVRPKKAKLDLMGDVYFPIEHSLAMLRAARAGKALLKADVYDGSETGEKVYTTSTAIGREYERGASKTFANIKQGDRLEAVPSWPVSVSYFERGNDKIDALPVYEIAYRLPENGVTSTLVIDHGEFALNGELKELIWLPQNKCPAAKP